MRRTIHSSWRWGLLWAACFAGCAVLQQPAGLELKPPKMAADSVLLEVFLVRLPAEEEFDREALWAEIDEMSLPADLRQRLRERGFRAGVTAGRIPVELERLMELAEAPTKTSADTSVLDFQSDSNVSRRILQMRAKGRGEILASKVFDRLSMFEKNGSQIDGRSYREAQCCFAVSGIPSPDGRVRLQVESEIQHGAPRNQVSLDGASFVMQLRRDRVALDSLKIETDLSPGQMLILGGTGETEGALGDYFFTEETDGGEARRLVLVRLAQTQQDALFNESDVDAK
jgi:hypothetical protein